MSGLVWFLIGYNVGALVMVGLLLLLQVIEYHRENGPL